MLKWVCFKVWIVHELDCKTNRLSRVYLLSLLFFLRCDSKLFYVSYLRPFSGYFWFRNFRKTLPLGKYEFSKGPRYVLGPKLFSFQKQQRHAIVIFLNVSRAMALPINRRPIKANDPARSRAFPCGIVANIVTRLQGVSRLLHICPFSIILPMLNNDLTPPSPTPCNRSNWQLA
jgi:hypothetical protein